MSKAFTRESDHGREQDVRAKPSLPANTPNYITVAGAQSFREQLDELLTVPQSPGNREKVFELQRIVRTAVPVEPPPAPQDTVQFGATVTVRDQSGEESIYRIVGVDEMDLERHWISWRSPLAKALLKAKVGDQVRFLAPGGQQRLEILAIKYE